MTINVDQYTPVLTWAAPAAITYGTALSSMQLDASADVPGAFAYTPSLGTMLNSGLGQMLSATFTPSDSTDYVSGGVATTNLDVNPAPLVIAADSKSAPYGGAVPTFTWKATGFVNGQTVAVLTATPTCTSTIHSAAGKITSPAGAYAITCSGASTSDYSISYTSGVMSVTLATAKLSYRGPTYIRHASRVTIAVKLTTSSGSALSGRDVLITLGKGGNLQTCTTGPTSSDGLAACVINHVKATARTGAPVNMKFAGDTMGPNYDYAAATASVSIPITV